MPLVFGAIAPHGGDILEEIADDPAVMAQTRRAMLEMGKRCQAARPDTVVVITPHGYGVRGAISVGATPTCAGFLDGNRPGRRIEAAWNTDFDFLSVLARETSDAQIPLLPISEGETKVGGAFWLDWGALIPLWYAAQSQTPRPLVVVLCPDRSLPRETLVRCGLAIARASDALPEKRVALIASCDQGHAHDPGGPYGYDPASAIHDKAMCEAIAANDLPRLLDWPQDFMETAKVDAYWQTIMLAGALGRTPMTGELLSYEAPTYFGMAVAAYSPIAAQTGAENG